MYLYNEIKGCHKLSSRSSWDTEGQGGGTVYSYLSGNGFTFPKYAMACATYRKDYGYGDNKIVTYHNYTNGYGSPLDNTKEIITLRKSEAGRQILTERFSRT